VLHRCRAEACAASRIGATRIIKDLGPQVVEHRGPEVARDRGLQASSYGAAVWGNQSARRRHEQHEVKLLRVLTDRGNEYCGNPERHEYELYLAVEDIDHSRTKTKSPQTNGICERFHKTVLNEFYRVAFVRSVAVIVSSMPVAWRTTATVARR